MNFYTLFTLLWGTWPAFLKISAKRQDTDRGNIFIN